MRTPPLTSALLGAALAGAGFVYTALAADPAPPAISTRPAATRPAVVSPILRVAKVNQQKTFAGFTRGDQLQKRFVALQRELQAAGQSGDNAKSGRLRQQLERIQHDVQRVMMDGLQEVAKEQKIQLVVGMRPGPGGSSELNAIYQQPEMDVPDITTAVVDRVNALAATRPSLDSQPASEPAPVTPLTQPTLRLNPRPKVRIQPPPPSK
jgi:hypothetical protein